MTSGHVALKTLILPAQDRNYTVDRKISMTRVWCVTVWHVCFSARAASRAQAPQFKPRSVLNNLSNYFTCLQKRAQNFPATAILIYPCFRS